MPRLSPITSDERDTKRAEHCQWTGGFGGPHPAVTAFTCQVSLFGPDGIFPPWTGPIRQPGAPFYLMGDALIPQFYLDAQVQFIASEGSQSVRLASYEFISHGPGNAPLVGSGTIDGQPFDLWGEVTGSSDPYTITSASITLVSGSESDPHPDNFYSWMGRFNTATGGFATGVTTNQWGPP